MSRIARRLYTSSSPPPPSSAASIASSFLTSSQSRPPHKHTRLLDANQLQLLSATLARPDAVPEDGTPIPAGYHLAYFTPSQHGKDLGRDGTHTTFNPPRPFTRRMWAGGELEWIAGREKGLKVGQRVTETTRLTRADGKRTRSGEEMVVVGVEKEFENEFGVAVIDRRNWIFRPEITTPKEPAPRPKEVPLPEGKYTRDLTQTPVSLFRFSALTFNGHRIHYDKEWCRQVEGHRDIVVHGPLNLIYMIDLWRDVNGGDELPRKITYRATSPLYGGEKYRIVVDEAKGKITHVRIVDSYGQVGMVGQIESV